MFDIGDCAPPQPTMIRSGKQDLVCTLEIFELYRGLLLISESKVRTQQSPSNRSGPALFPASYPRRHRVPPSEQLDVRHVIDPDPTDPGCRGIDGSLAPPQGRGPNPERLGHFRYRQVAGLAQLEHSPVTAAVVGAVGEPRNTVSVVPSLKGDDQPAATLAAGLPQGPLKATGPRDEPM